MILYHYTSTSSFKNIIQKGILNPSSPWTTMDSAYGHGWYFTDLPPEKCDAWTVAHCWRTLKAFERVECYLKFDIADSVITKCRDHVWIVTQPDWNGDINKSWPIQYLEGKSTPRCGKGIPCLLCDTINAVKNFFGIS